MEDFYKSFALVTCGVSLAMGSVYLYLGTLHRSMTYLLFGMLGISLCVFYLLPPAGFILEHNPPYDSVLIFKGIFIFTYYAITPWFILAYTGYPRKWPAYAISGVVVACYVLMIFTPASEGMPLWPKLALLNFCGVLFLAHAGARWLQQQGHRGAARSLYAVIFTFVGLLILSVFSPLFEVGWAHLFTLKLYFLIQLHSLFFMLIMGQHLVLDLYDKFKLEQHLHQTEARWNSFMANAPLLTLELDREGRILFVNDFGAKLLGYQHLSDLLEFNWFDVFVTQGERQSLKSHYQQIVEGTSPLAPALKVTIRTRHGETLVLSWSTFPVANAEGKIQKVMTICRNVTDEEKATRLVVLLKVRSLTVQPAWWPFLRL